MVSYKHLNVRSLPAFLGGWIVIGAFLTTYEVAFGQQGAAESVSVPNEARLQWKFVPEQVLRIKTAFGIKTDNSQFKKDITESKTTTFIYDVEWEIQAVDVEGTASIMASVDRIRFRHRSPRVEVDYDSLKDDSFHLTDESKIEIGVFLQQARDLRSSKYSMTVTRQGVVKDLKSVESDNAFVPKGLTPHSWPFLPATVVKVGESWTDGTDEKSAKKYKLAKIERIDGDTVAYIESNSDGSLSRFSVDQGRFVDAASWITYKIKGKSEEQNVQSVSRRQRIDLEGSTQDLTKWKPLQHIDPKRVHHCFRQSFEQTDKIKEFLLDERDLLSGVQQRLFIEFGSFKKFLETSKHRTPIDWLMTARLYERLGKNDECKKSLHGALDSARAATEEDSYQNSFFLLQIAERLAALGDFVGSREASLAISSKANEGLNFTARGVVEVPESSMQSYAMLLTGVAQAQAGDFVEAAKTAEMIACKPARSAAYWVMALRQAEKGNLTSADEHARLAVNVDESRTISAKRSQVIEFTDEGPRPVPLGAYRMLSLGSIAHGRALSGDEDGASQAILSIPDSSEQLAATSELIVSLERHGRRDLADKWADRVPEPFRSIAWYHRAAQRLTANDLAGSRQAIETIKDAEWQAASRLNFCRALATSEKSAELPTQLSLARTTIDEIMQPVVRVQAFLGLADIQSSAGDKQEAKEVLLIAKKLCDDSNQDKQQKINDWIQIAAGLANAGALNESEELVGLVRKESEGLGAFDRSAALLELVRVQLLQNAMGPAQDLASSILDASFRCRGQADVARRYAEMLELEQSRDLFAKAFSSAMQVNDVMGLDTVYSKGGAVRFVGRVQAECDLEGLVNYLFASSDANIKAYGYLSAAESGFPAAAEAADRRGNPYPRGLLNELS